MSNLLFYSPEHKVIDSLLGGIRLTIQREPVCICEAKLFSIFPWKAKTGSSVFQVYDIERLRSWLQILILISHFLPINPNLLLEFSWQMCSSCWVLICSSNLGTYLIFSEVNVYPAFFFFLMDRKEVCYMPFKCNNISCS